MVYSLGESLQCPPAVYPISVGNLLAKVVHTASYLSPLARLLPTTFGTSNLLDLHIESRKLGFTETSFVSFLGQLWKSDWAESEDAAPFDVTFGAVEKREFENWHLTHPKTYYRSYAACMVSSALL